MSDTLPKVVLFHATGQMERQVNPAMVSFDKPWGDAWLRTASEAAADTRDARICQNHNAL